MISFLRLVVPPVLLALAGSGAAFHPSLRDLGVAARAAAAFLAGAVGLAVEGVLFTLVGIPWSLGAFLVPSCFLSGALAYRWRRGRSGPAPRKWAVPAAIGVASAVAAGFALAHLAASLATMRATSVDYVFFWGVKAARFAQARAIDVPLLKTPFFIHSVPSYPPLVPVVGAWRFLANGVASWKLGVIDALLWILAAVPLVLALLRRALPDATAAAATAFWTCALSISLAFSFSGGSAEAPLLVFESVAGAALLVEIPAAASSRFLPALMLAGAALTKVEGLVGGLTLAFGTLLRDRAESRPKPLGRALPLFAAPLAAVGLWFGFQALSGLPVGYAGHGAFLDLHFANLGAIARTAVIDLRAGCAGLSWLLPLAFLVFAARNRAAAVPGLVFVLFLFLFLGFDYLHDTGDPWERVGWTLPRVSQPALSMLILTAAAARMPRGRVENAEAGLG